ncbi:MAG: PKD domain-containing protein, partial [archaeon]
SGPLTVEFNATGSTSQENRVIEEYKWDFKSDNYTDKKGEIVENTYYTLGKHQATLTVKDNKGEEDSYQKEIEVKESEGGTYLSVDAKDVGEGYAYLEAEAGIYEDNQFTCEDIKVEAEFEGHTYVLKDPEDKTNCFYTRQIYMGSGEHEVKFTAIYPDGRKEEVKEVKIKGMKPSIRIYNPLEDAKAVVNTSIDLEAGAVKREDYEEGEFTVEMDGIEEKLERRDTGTYRGTLKSNETGEKTLTFTFKDEDWEVQKQRNITILSEEEADEMEETEKLRIVYPRDGTRIPLDENRFVMISLIGEDGRIISDQEINYFLRRYNETVEDRTVSQRDRLYVTSQRFTEPGEYNLEVEWENLEDSIDLKVGDPEDIPEERKLKIDAVTPRRTTYSKDSEIRIIARTKKEEEYIHEPNVTYRLGTEEEKKLEKTDREGEWRGNLRKLDEGRYTLTLKAVLDEEVAMETVDFLVTGKYLEVNPMKPTNGQDINIDKGKSIEIEAEIIDQNKIIADNAHVEAFIESSEGKRSRALMEQDSETGIYKADYYPEETDTYEITIKAQKSGHLSEKSTIQTDINIENEEKSLTKMIASLDLYTLMKIALGLAIVILILAIIHPLRFIAG